MSATALQWAVAGGGTGGHVTPALAIAEEVAARGERVFLLGSPYGLETRLVPEAGFELIALPARQVMGQGLLGRLRAAVTIAAGCFAARSVLRKRRPNVVVSVGGYASLPAVVAAASLGIPVALVEPNAKPGRANRLMARFASRIFVQFEEAAATLGRRPGDPRVAPLGIPLRRALVEAFSPGDARRQPSQPLHVLVFGGSQGATQINEAMMECANALRDGPFEVFHQTGEADRERVTAAYARAGLAATVVAFESDMPKRYREADVALCRSGALTVAELAMAGLPSLLVPYPFAADDHQAANAQALARAGAARVLPNRPLAASDVARALSELAAAPDTLIAMGESARALARPDAAARIVSACASLCRPGEEPAA
ncbi:MAG: undecaprenyldiphospho-muramoylpentapeptide beta-N-acetylglucosaminyltransferase [Candidatus Krumholzibacteria bacterium]|nr:undecaprenyldiphospho-muramoylpentapeptide beta-N-acetylglucosaminyltransferase [Candidatus Krumholzibacteria bacterium]